MLPLDTGAIILEGRTVLQTSKITDTTGRN